MNCKITEKGLKIYTVCFLLLIYLIGITEADTSNNKGDELPGLQEVLGTVNKSVRNNDFQILKPYVSDKEPLRWSPCGPGDVEPEDVLFSNLVARLSKLSKGASIKVYSDPDISQWDIEKTVFIVEIVTEGWIGEYPFLSFGFKYLKANNQWQFQGICESADVPVTDFKIHQKAEKNLEPQLPRPGKRVFKDSLALRNRIEEVVHFKEFEALRPYAIRKKVLFGECNHEALKNDEIKGSEVQVEKVIVFLKNNSEKSKEIKPAKGHYYKYFETQGWSGDYPYISFWFKESKKGWEWDGVVYCRSSLMHVLFPDEPRFK